jgi:hypothetical protein
MGNMYVIQSPITREKLRTIARERFGDLVKAVIDTKKEIMAVGGELHADEEVLLIEEHGSERIDTWGINLYPDKEGEEFVEFDSMVNIKPAQKNRSRSVEDETLRENIKRIVQKLIIE